MAKRNIATATLKAEGMELATDTGITQLTLSNPLGSAKVCLSLNAIQLRNINDQLLLAGRADGVVSMSELEISDRLLVNGKEISGGGG